MAVPLGERASRSDRAATRALATWKSGAVLETPGFVAGLDDVAVMSEAIEQSGGHLGITEHLWMPQRLTGESLECGWLIRTIPYMASASRSVTDARDGDRG